MPVNIIMENMQQKVEYTPEMEKLFSLAAELSLQYENFTTDCEISLLLVDNEAIREMNKTHRGKDSSTDILSFPMALIFEGSLESDEGDYNLDEELLLLGDIVISMEKVREQAVEYGHSFERELAFLFTHGMFHLLGYDHENEQEEKRMMEKQEAVLSQMGLKRTV